MSDVIFEKNKIPAIFVCPLCGGEFLGMDCTKCGFEVGTIAEYMFDFSVEKNKIRDTAESSSAQISRIKKDVFTNLLLDEAGVDFHSEAGLFLDVGCGTGYYSKKVFGDGPNAKTVGIDLDPSFSVEIAGENYVFAKADIFTPPFKENAFDGVVSFDVIEHVQDDVAFLKSVFKLLKKDGKFAIGTPNKNRLTSKVEEVFKGKKRFPYNYGDSSIVGQVIHIREYSYAEMKSLFGKFSDRIKFTIKPLLFGARVGTGIVGILRPGMPLAELCQYWLVCGQKTV